MSIMYMVDKEVETEPVFILWHKDGHQNIKQVKIKVSIELCINDITFILFSFMESSLCIYK